jgi:hypothetical protein
VVVRAVPRFPRAVRRVSRRGTRPAGLVPGVRPRRSHPSPARLEPRPRSHRLPRRLRPSVRVRLKSGSCRSWEGEWGRTQSHHRHSGKICTVLMYRYFESVLWIRIIVNADSDPAFYLDRDSDPDAGSQNADPCGSGSWLDFVVIKR